MSKLAWGAKVSPEFVKNLMAMAKSFGWTGEQASYLMACMAFESGETFSASIKNAAGSGATGLIQFMPATAKGLRTTCDMLAQMRPEDQLQYVRKYFRPYASRVKTLSDMYLAILLPKYVGHPETTVLFSGGVSYRQNSGLDADKDGKVTKKEAAAKVQAKLEKGMKPGFALEYEE